VSVHGLDELQNRPSIPRRQIAASYLMMLWLVGTLE
jgi:hypothetical protein